MIGVARPVTAALLSAAILIAAEQAPAQSCASASQRELDFMVGNWLVSDSSGQVTGTTTIRKASGGCVLIEQWRGTGKLDEGLGVIDYDPARTSWHRDFLDQGGVVLALDGRLDGQTMVMTGNDYALGGARMNRVTWAPQPDGTITQSWQTSTDGGQSWRSQLRARLRRIAE
jgi:hypothetical protein